MEQIEWIRHALKEKNIPVSKNAMDLFRRYRSLLLEWNRRINLISENDKEKIVSRHFLGSIGLLRVVDFPEGTRLLDLGSGAGFPGVPLKIIRPDIHLILVESVRKKVSFLERVIDSLQLIGVDVVCGRMEEVAPDIGAVDFVLSRAVADFSTLAAWSRPCLSQSGGSLIAIKGAAARQEFKRLLEEKERMGVEDGRCIRYDPFPERARLDSSWVLIGRFYRIDAPDVHEGSYT